MTYLKSLFLPSYSKLEEDRRKHETKGPQEKYHGGGQNDIRGVQKALDLVVSGAGVPPLIRPTQHRPHPDGLSSSTEAEHRGQPPLPMAPRSCSSFFLEPKGL